MVDIYSIRDFCEPVNLGEDISDLEVRVTKHRIRVSSWPFCFVFYNTPLKPDLDFGNADSICVSQ